MIKSAISRRRLLKADAAANVAMQFVVRNAFADQPIKLGSLLDGTGPLGLDGGLVPSTRVRHMAVDSA